MDQFELEVSTALSELGIKPHLHGHECIKVALNILHENPSAILQIGKFYSDVGNAVGVSPSKVVKNITFALENVSSDFNAKKKVLGTAREMTTTEFVATLSEAIKLRLADKTLAGVSS